MKMEKVARTYKARFVVNVGELGEDDPLMQNVMQFSLGTLKKNYVVLVTIEIQGNRRNLLDKLRLLSYC